ncbi:MAG: FAD-dependent oxidoreductase [Methylobacter sp.]|nr:FAD-dependent oxidoreductase [Methylobacter sp.]
MLDIAIIGAGLSGLSLADRPLESKRNIAVFEARNRCGGRILSHSITSTSDAAAFEVDLGPAWLWPDHQLRIAALVKRLGLELFRQWDSGHSLYQTDSAVAPMMFIDTETNSTARRIKGGCRQLTDGLLHRLPHSILHLQHSLLKLTNRDTYVDLKFTTENGRAHYQARQAVLAAPPRLLADSVIFKPELAPIISSTVTVRNISI